MDGWLYRYRGPLLGALVLAAYLLGGASWHCLAIDVVR